MLTPLTNHNLAEEPPHQASSKIADNRTAECAVRECRGLAETVTSRERSRIRDRQDKGDS